MKSFTCENTILDGGGERRAWYKCFQLIALRLPHKQIAKESIGGILPHHREMFGKIQNVTTLGKNVLKGGIKEPRVAGEKRIAVLGKESFKKVLRLSKGGEASLVREAGPLGNVNLHSRIAFGKHHLGNGKF